MVLRRGRRSADRPSPTAVEVELEPNDPLSGAPAGGGDPAPTSFPPPHPEAAVPHSAASAPARRIAAVPRDHSNRGKASRMLPVRITLVAIMGVALAWLASRAFDELVRELLLPPVLVAAVALVARRWRPTYRALLATIAVTGATAAVGLLRDVALGDLVAETIDGPRRLVTTEWPSPIDPGVVMVIAFGLGLVTAVAADLAGRPRLHVAPLAPVAIGFVAAMAISAPVHPAPWPVALLSAAAILLLMARPGADPRSRLRAVIAERSLSVTVVGLLIVGLVAASVITWTDRADPRQDVEAELTLSLLDPVEQMVALRTADPDFRLFEITDRSALIGPSLPTRWRLSALDQYDGQRWLPAATLRPIGSRLGQPSPTNPDLAPPIKYELEILTDDISLIPLPGRPLELDADDDAVISTDEQRSVVRFVETPEPGARAVVTAEVAPTVAAGDSNRFPLRQVDEISRTFEDKATELAGDEVTLVAKLRAIESAMRDDWFLDDEAGGGQQLALIQIFVNDSNRGTSEQFATAFVLLARSLGVDARIATGLVVPPDELESPLVLRSTHAAVWPEARVDGLGWVAFDPVPPEQADAADDDTPPPSQQSPAAAQPPAPEPPERTDDEAEQTDEPEADTSNLGSVSVWLGRSAVIAGAAILPIIAAVSAILLLKWRRRRRRLKTADPAQRIIGAWANATDSLVDAGLTIGPAWTDDRIAEHANAIAPSMPHDMRRLAATATAMTFGRTEHSRFLVDDAVATSRSIDVAIRSERSRWQRLRWRLSMRSLRKATRSPVAG